MGVYWNPSNQMSGYYRSLEKSAQNVVLQTQGASGNLGKVKTPTGIGYYVDASGNQTGSGGPGASSAKPETTSAASSKSSRSIDREVRARLAEKKGRIGALELAQLLRESGVTPEHPLTPNQGLARKLKDALSGGKFERDLHPLLKLINAGHRPALVELLKQS